MRLKYCSTASYGNYLNTQKKVKEQKLNREVVTFLGRIKSIETSNDILSNAKIAQEIKNTSQDILIGAISKLIRESK